jgi:hypothetical protein
MIKINYSGYRFPPEIFQHAIWLYIRFTLSFRDVEDGPMVGRNARGHRRVGNAPRYPSKILRAVSANCVLARHVGSLCLAA